MDDAIMFTSDRQVFGIMIYPKNATKKPYEHAALFENSFHAALWGKHITKNGDEYEIVIHEVFTCHILPEE